MSRLSDTNPILKTKLNIQEKLNNIFEEKCLILECIEDMISKAESAVENILNENDRMKFLAAYRLVNRYLESCSEKLLEIHIILSEENSSDNCVSIKTSTSSLCVEDNRSVRDECNGMPVLHSKASGADIQFIPQIDPVPNVSEPNSEFRNIITVIDAVKTIPSTIVGNKSLIDISAQDKSFESSASLCNSLDEAINKDNSAKFIAQVSNCFSPTSSYHSFSSLSNSPNALHKEVLQDLPLCLSRSESLAKSVKLMHIVDDNSLVNINSSKSDITPQKYPQTSTLDEDSKPSSLRHKIDDNSLSNTSCNKINVSKSLDENAKTVTSRPKVDSKSQLNASFSRTNTPLPKYPQNSLTGEDFKAIISKNKRDNLLIDTRTTSQKHQQNLCSDENSKDQSPLPDSDGMGDGFQFCVKRESPKPCSIKLSDTQETNCIIPPYQVEVAVNITFVENPTNFWLQPNKQQFQELLTQLQCVQVNSSPSYLVKGRHYLAPYGSDNGWHRVKLVQEPLADDFAIVQYIDYGNEESISTATFKSLTSSLSAFPAQAVHCHLKGVKSDERDTSVFVELLEESSVSDSLFAIFSPPKSEKYPVELIIKSVTSPYSLNIAQHIRNHQKESCTSFSETNAREETCHHSERDLAENDPENDDDLFACAVNQEVAIEEVDTNSKEIDEGENDFHNTSDSTFFNSWPEKKKVNFSSASECSLSSSHSSSIKSWKDEDRLCEDGDWDIEVPEPAIVLLQNNSVPVMVSVIVDPKEFYIHIVSEDTCQLDDLAEQLNNYYTKSYKRTSSVKPLQIGSYCACQFAADNCWYRAVVLEILEDSKSRKLQAENTLDVIVQYIDYGNKVCVSSEDLHPLPVFLARLPAFAVNCALAHLQPPSQENSNSENQWPKKTIARFRELTGFEKCFTAQFLSPIEYQYKVILWDSEEMSINDILIQEGLAIKDNSEEHEFERSKSDPGSLDGIANGWNPMADDYLNECNMYEVDMDDPEIAFTGYKTTDEKYICKFFSRDGKCRRGDKCVYKHIKNEGNMTLDKEEVFSYDLSIDLPKVGTCVLAQVSAVFNPIHFYIIFPYGTISVDDTNIFTYSVRENLDKFVKSMSIYYNTTKVKKNITFHALGKIVAVKSKFDHNWYRARIQDTNSSNKLIKVFYVDFGNCEWVPQHDVEEIDTKFMEFPFQAVECRLANVQNTKIDPELKKLSWDLFRQLTENKIVLAHIVGHDHSMLLVKLHSVTAKSDTSINDELIVRGLAFPED